MASGNHATIQVKANQPKLCEELAAVEKTSVCTDIHILEEDENGVKNTWQICKYEFTSTLDKWKMILTFLVIHKISIKGTLLTYHKRYYVSTNDIYSAKEFNKGIREHWQIENHAHRPKDMYFNQDHNQTNTHNNAVNRAVLNTIALNNLTNEFPEQPKKIKENQILFRGNLDQFLQKHRI